MIFSNSLKAKVLISIIIGVVVIANRLHDYIQQENLSPEDRIFPICYSTARALIKNLEGRLNVVLTPHDLRRYSATYASRNGVPLEIVSK